MLLEILEILFLNISQEQICFISSVDYLGTQWRGQFGKQC